MITTRSSAGQAIFLLCLPAFAVMGAVALSPLLPRIEHDFAASEHVQLLVPLLLTAPALCMSLLSPLAGRVTDRLGGRRIVLISLCLYGFAGVAPVFLHSLEAILASRLIVGLAEAGLVIGSTALLGLCYDEDARQKWFAIQCIALPLLGSAIVAVAGVLADHSWRLAFCVYAVSLIALPLGFWLLPDARGAAQPLRDRATTWPPLKVLALIACIAIPGSVYFYIGPVQIAYLLAHRGFQQPSTASLVTSIAMIVGPPAVLLTRRLRHMPVGVILALSMLLLGTGMIIMATGQTAPVIGLGLLIQQAGGAIMYSTALTYTVSLAAASVQGAYSGAFYTIYGLAQFITPFITSTTIDLTGDRLTSVLVSGCAAVATGVLLVLLTPLRRPLVVAC